MHSEFSHHSEFSIQHSLINHPTHLAAIATHAGGRDATGAATAPVHAQYAIPSLVTLHEILRGNPSIVDRAVQNPQLMHAVAVLRDAGIFSEASFASVISRLLMKGPLPAAVNMRSDVITHFVRCTNYREATARRNIAPNQRFIKLLKTAAITAASAINEGNTHTAIPYDTILQRLISCVALECGLPEPELHILHHAIWTMMRTMGPQATVACVLNQDKAALRHLAHT
jgi:hypothetical protein